MSKYTKLLRWSLFAGSAYFLVVAAISIIAKITAGGAPAITVITGQSGIEF